MTSRRPSLPMNYRAVLVQVIAVGGFLAMLGYFAWTAWQRMRAQGIAYGLDFLTRPTGWRINSPFMNHVPEDPYWWTFLVAFVNTATASVMSILCACMLGVTVGVGLTTSNGAFRTACRIYVEAFRNLPLVLQAVFWYVTFTKLPSSRESPPSLGSFVYLSNQGLYFPGGTVQEGFVGLTWVVFAVIALVGIGSWWICSRMSVRGVKRVGICFAASTATALTAFALGAPLPRVEVPSYGDFGIVGGIELPIELLALVFATVLFGSAYIGEIVRGGLQAVPKGLVEAAQALGLPPRVVFLRVRFPVALRFVIPPLSNQFLFMIKATAIGAAIGYSDVFAVTSVAIGQTGQAVELVLLMMLVYFSLNFAIAQAMNLANRLLAFPGRGA